MQSATQTFINDSEIAMKANDVTEIRLLSFTQRVSSEGNREKWRLLIVKEGEKRWRFAWVCDEDANLFWYLGNREAQTNHSFGGMCVNGS